MKELRLIAQNVGIKTLSLDEQISMNPITIGSKVLFGANNPNSIRNNYIKNVLESLDGLMNSSFAKEAQIERYGKQVLRSNIKSSFIQTNHKNFEERFLEVNWDYAVLDWEEEIYLANFYTQCKFNQPLNEKFKLIPCMIYSNQYQEGFGIIKN